ncbi:MAG: ZIP family metal transporter [Chloroflexi bacterium]|nr:ZIP family metal transporter [Chloroflexota bacterium]
MIMTDLDVWIECTIPFLKALYYAANQTQPADVKLMPMSPLITLLILAFIGSVAGLIGGVILLFRKKWAKSLAADAIPLAAGVLLAVSLLDLLPQAVDKVGDLAFTIVLGVFVTLYLVERFLFFLHHHDVEDGHEAHRKETVPLIIFGDTIHNFLDGVAIAAGFLVSPSLGAIVALSTFLHETPHEIADFGILLANGWSPKKAFAANFLSAIATFPGALLTYYFAAFIEPAVGILLAVAAGLFLYIAATDFLPETEHAPKEKMGRQALFLIIGVLAIAALKLVAPELP